MALIFADRVKETSTTTGTGTIDLDGAAIGFEGFVVGVGNTNTCHYCITDNVDWEVGIGTVTDAATDTLSRDTIYSSSNADAAVNWGAGTRTVFVTHSASDITDALRTGDIGTSVQAYDATLTSIALLGTAADKMAYTTALDTWAETALTAAGRALIDDASAAAQRTTLGLVIGTDVQAYDATLLRTTDVDDTPVNAATTAPISSNWAYDHINTIEEPHSQYVRNNQIVQNTNPWALNKFLDDFQSNRFHGRSSEIKVLIDTVENTVNKPQCFDGSHEGTWVMGTVAGPDVVLSFDTVTYGLTPSTGFTYVNGYIWLSFYPGRGPDPSGVTGRWKNKDGVWTAITFTDEVIFASEYIGFKGFLGGNYLVELEVTLTPHTTSGFPLALSEVEYLGDRMTISEGGLITRILVNDTPVNGNTTNPISSNWANAHNVANNHIDWTADQGATNIHLGNYSAGITYEQLDTNGDVGTSAGQLAIGNHLHTGVYEPADSAIQTHLGDATKHRLINDAGTLTTELFSASKIISDLSGKSDTGHVHAINDLSDVTNATPLDKHVLVYDGVTDNKYENRLLVEADVSDLQSYILAAGVTYEQLDTNGDVGTTAGTLAIGNHTHAGVYEPAFSKNTGFNLNLGTIAGTVSEGDHIHAAGDITTGTFADALIAQTNVTQHEGALTITESQVTNLVSDLALKAPLASPAFTGNSSTVGYHQAAGFASDITDMVRIVSPGGASFRTGTAISTGTIRIKLPVLNSTTMMRMTIQVYNYVTDESFTVYCGGYNHSTAWINCFAYILADPTVDRQFNVRFGDDGSNNTIQIGEIASTWDYVQVSVTDFQGGYTGGISNETWNDGWDVTIQNTLDTIDVTVPADQLGRTQGTNLLSVVNGTETLTNKTLTAPVTTGVVDVKGSLSNSTGDLSLNDNTFVTGTLEVSSWCEINGAPTTGAQLGVTYNSGATAGIGLVIEDTDTGASSGPEISLHRNSASPAAFDWLGVLWFDGEDSAGNVQTYTALAGRSGSVTSGSEYGILYIYNVVNGTYSYNSQFYVGFMCGSPTGSHNAAGTVWAQAVYDDNTLLTCYVFDQKIDGVISDAKWDANAPDRVHPAMEEIKEKRNDAGKITHKGQAAIPEIIEARTHEPMKQFKARMGTQYDPLDIDKYAQHWKDKKHLTSMPNEDKYDPNGDSMSTGQWIQRLVETVEIQAIHIESLNERLKALETV